MYRVGSFLTLLVVFAFLVGTASAATIIAYLLNWHRFVRQMRTCTWFRFCTD